MSSRHDVVFVRPGATLAGDIAYEFGTNSITTAHNDGSSVVSPGRSLTVWQRGPDGSWLIVAGAPMAGPV